MGAIPTSIPFSLPCQKEPGLLRSYSEVHCFHPSAQLENTVCAQAEPNTFCKLLFSWLEAEVGEWDSVLATDIKWQFIEESLEFQEETTTSSEKSLLFFLPL